MRRIKFMGFSAPLVLVGALTGGLTPLDKSDQPKVVLKRRENVVQAPSLVLKSKLVYQLEQRCSEANYDNYDGVVKHWWGRGYFFSTWTCKQLLDDIYSGKSIKDSIEQACEFPPYAIPFCWWALRL